MFTSELQQMDKSVLVDKQKHHLCSGNGCCVENLQRTMTDRKEGKRDARESVLSAQFDDEDLWFKRKSNHWYYIAILETIWQCINEWIVLNKIISVK